MSASNRVCLWYDRDALTAAKFYVATFPRSEIVSTFTAPRAMPGGDVGDVVGVEAIVFGIPWLGLNVGPGFAHTYVFSFQIVTETQAETDQYWDAIVGSGGEAGTRGWCKDRWGISWQITPRLLMDTIIAGGEASLRVVEVLDQMTKIDIAALEAARRG